MHLLDKAREIEIEAENVVYGVQTPPLARSLPLYHLGSKHVPLKLYGSKT